MYSCRPMFLGGLAKEMFRDSRGRVSASAPVFRNSLREIDLENAMNTALSEKWGALRGLKVVSIAFGSITLPDEDAELIKQAQRTAIMRDPTMAAATLVGAQADAMKTAAGNEAGAMTGFMGMGMAMNAAGGGMNAQNLFAMGQQQQAQQATPTPQPTPAPQAAGGWKCACGTTVTGNFCPNCGAKMDLEEKKHGMD